VEVANTCCPYQSHNISETCKFLFGSLFLAASIAIVTIRKELGLTQVAFADALGVSFATVNRWENDRTIPSKLALSALESLLIKKSDAKQKYKRNEIAFN